jgi:hypothetical protein
MRAEPTSPEDATRQDTASASRQREFACAKQVWADHRILGTSGVVTFLTYLSVPHFTLVPWHAPERAKGTLAAEQLFIMRLLGLSDESAWYGGIDNPIVSQMVRDTARRHRTYAGMQTTYLDVMAEVIALAPLRVRTMMTMPVTSETRVSYWKYMRRAMAIFGCPLPDEDAAETHSAQYIALHARRSERGAQLLGLVAAAHPQYVSDSIPPLFPACQNVVRELIGDVNATLDMQTIRI